MVINSPDRHVAQINIIILLDSVQEMGILRLLKTNQLVRNKQAADSLCITT